MSNVVAGVGRGQLKVLDKRVDKKRSIYFYYKEQLSDIKDIEFMPLNEEWSYSNCWLTSILLKGKIKPIDLIVALEEENIESRPLWKPMHLQPFFEKYDFIGEHISDDMFERGLCLPSDSKMTIEEQDKVIKVIKELFKNA